MLSATKCSTNTLREGLNFFKDSKVFRNVFNYKSRNQRFLHDAAKKPNPKLTGDQLQFDQTLPDIIKEITSYEHTNIPEISYRIKRSLEYNLTNGKKNRGLTVVGSYKLLEKPEKLTEENIRLANILGWSVEMLQAFFIVIDDITDGSETRRGKLCWYKQEDIGTTGINDGLFLENIVYTLLKEHFAKHPSYVQLMESFHDVTLFTTIGQMLDCNTLNVNSITMDRYEKIAVFKTAYYSSYLPVCLAMYLSNFTDPELHRQSRDILLEIGKFFQIQDDFLDCFGDPKVTGKIGTDIETNKCTWLAVTAMQLASDEQKRIMEDNYGRQEDKNVKAVKDLYVTLNIPELYTEYEDKSYEFLQERIRNLPKNIPPQVFNQFISRIYKRVK